MHKRIPTVLFIGTSNSSRSIIAESILNEDFGDRFMGFSSGSAPNGNVHPITLKILKSIGHETSYLRSKSWSEFGTPDALHIDFSITLCDRTLEGKCPILNGRPITAKWGILDPAKAQGGEAEQYAAFKIAYKTIHDMITQFARLPFRSLNRTNLTEKVGSIAPRHSTIEYASKHFAIPSNRINVRTEIHQVP